METPPPIQPITQMEYDQEILKLKQEHHEKLIHIEQRCASNLRQKEFLEQQIHEAKEKCRALGNENFMLNNERKEIARDIYEKRELLRTRLIAGQKLREIPSTLAYRIHLAVEAELKRVLADVPDIDTERIKFNYHFDDEGIVSFECNIPTAED